MKHMRSLINTKLSLNGRFLFLGANNIIEDQRGFKSTITRLISIVNTILFVQVRFYQPSTVNLEIKVARGNGKTLMTRTALENLKLRGKSRQKIRRDLAEMLLTLGERLSPLPLNGPTGFNLATKAYLPSPEKAPMKNSRSLSGEISSGNTTPLP